LAQVLKLATRANPFFSCYKRLVGCWISEVDTEPPL